MLARPGASLCSLLFLWLCALGAGPIGHTAQPPVVARSAVELALRDVAGAPLLVPRSVSQRAHAARLTGRDAPSSQLVAPIAITRATALATTRRAPGVVARQGEAHAARRRWRAYDAAAPPAPSRITR
jgi:hypothetical protein